MGWFASNLIIVYIFYDTIVLTCPCNAITSMFQVEEKTLKLKKMISRNMSRIFD
jgi:hypothetical protein